MIAVRQKIQQYNWMYHMILPNGRWNEAECEKSERGKETKDFIFNGHE